MERVPFSFRTVPDYLVKATSEIELVVALTGYNTRMYSFFSCSIKPPCDEISSKTLASVARINGA
jgi:hypothetical protein